MGVCHPAETVDDGVPVEALPLGRLSAVIAETRAPGKLNEPLHFRKPLSIGRRSRKAQETRLDEIEFVACGQLGKKRAGKSACIGVVHTDGYRKGVPVNIALQAVGKLGLQPFLVHPGVGELHADLHPSAAGQVDRELNPVGIPKFGIFGLQGFDPAVLVIARIKMPVGPRVFGPVDLSARIMRVVELR